MIGSTKAFIVIKEIVFPLLSDTKKILVVGFELILELTKCGTLGKGITAQAARIKRRARAILRNKVIYVFRAVNHRYNVWTPEIVPVREKRCPVII